MRRRGKKLTKRRTTKGDWKERFLRKLAKTGNIGYAAAYAKVARQTVYDRRNKEPEFAVAMIEARRIAQAYLEEEARRRAEEGWDEPVYYKGIVCGRVRKFSDTLLMFLLKANKPSKFRERTSVEHSGHTVTDVRVVRIHPPGVQSLDVTALPERQSLNGHHETNGDG